MKHAFLLGLCLSWSGVAQAIEPASWLQDRMDRVQVAAGQEVEPVHAVLTDERTLHLDQQGTRLKFPRVLVAIAPSPEAVDGLLALLLSYSIAVRKDPPGSRPRASVTGAGSDPDTARTRGNAPADANPPSAAPDPLVLRKQRAWRGIGWYGRTRGCTAELVEYLRLIATGGSAVVNGKTIDWPASRPAREVLNDLGSLAYPSGEQCKLRPDPAFVSARAQAAADITASSISGGPAFGP